jgi:multidrug efflux pump subunit AcrA (membrane-fusion protein)
MKMHLGFKLTLSILAVTALVAAGWFTREAWLPWLPSTRGNEPPPDSTPESVAVADRVLLTEQTQKNLGLTTRALKVENFWKTITVPGMIVDRPGHTDRGVVAPLTGVVKTIHHFPGDTVKPGEPLFTLRILSETLHTTQTELFKAIKDITLAQAQKKRLASAAEALPESRLIEVENQITRLETAVKAHRQELLNRGLTEEQIAAASEGKFVAEVTVRVPPRPLDHKPLVSPSAALQAGSPRTASSEQAFEVQELKVELGYQVQAGQTLCTLANHQMLAIEGKAFREETPLLERAVREHGAVDVDFQEEFVGDWPTLEQSFLIRQISNTIDPVTRTFTFLIPFENQSRVVERDGKTIVLWRFRPGHQVRLNLRVEELKGVFVLPPEAVVREGGEAYVFRQNGDMYDRKPVHVVYQDRRNVVIANDGSVPPGIFVAQTAAAQLNRMIKAQSNSLPKGFHIHADGSIHMGDH